MHLILLFQLCTVDHGSTPSRTVALEPCKVATLDNEPHSSVKTLHRTCTLDMPNGRTMCCTGQPVGPFWLKHITHRTGTGQYNVTGQSCLTSTGQYASDMGHAHIIRSASPIEPVLARLVKASNDQYWPVECDRPGLYDWYWPNVTGKIHRTRTGQPIDRQYASKAKIK
ncbi:hypothetical protein BDR04DRAFT_1112559 [Suillus decipiens]|nr:hypothetical protein BDR04DRAFT_1112559 [Suillus decipiens]